MKKNYYSPLMKVVPMKSKVALLAGSGGIGESEGGSASIGGQGVDGDDGD